MPLNLTPRKDVLPYHINADDPRNRCFVCGEVGTQWANSHTILVCERHEEGLVRWTVPK